MGVLNGNPGQSAKLNVRQSVFAAKSPNLMFAECITPTVYHTIIVVMDQIMIMYSIANLMLTK